MGNDRALLKVFVFLALTGSSLGYNQFMNKEGFEAGALTLNFPKSAVKGSSEESQQKEGERL